MLLQQMIDWLHHYRSPHSDVIRRDEGQGLVEYALILIFVAVVVVFLIAILGPGVGNMYSNIVAALQGGG